MKNSIAFKSLLAGATLFAASASADNRVFTYSYEPQTEPKGEWELEQWFTARLMRNDAVGQRDYQKYEFRTEVCYGVTDRYTTALYINDKFETYSDPGTGATTSKNRFAGISWANRYMVLDPLQNPVGLTLYLEPTYDGEHFELEQKIILGQKHGDWRWAVNFIHETEWENDFREKVGEFEFTAGVARQLSRRWAIGLEFRSHNEIPEYDKWESSALYFGPVISYRRQQWWAAFAVMPQIFGANYGGNPDGNSSLDLADHERLNIRLLAGFTF